MIGCSLPCHTPQVKKRKGSALMILHTVSSPCMHWECALLMEYGLFTTSTKLSTFSAVHSYRTKSSVHDHQTPLFFREKCAHLGFHCTIFIV